MSGSCLVDELVVRDFTINAMYYDPVNRIVIDPSGFARDAGNMALRPPVPIGLYPFGCRAIRRLMRFFVFLSRGYQPCNLALQTYIAAQTRKFISCSTCGGRTLSCPTHQMMTSDEVQVPLCCGLAVLC